MQKYQNGIDATVMLLKMVTYRKHVGVCNKMTEELLISHHSNIQIALMSVRVNQ
jgi:hypothetical protein